MAVKSLSTRIAIIGRGAKCSGGSSAVDRSAYISRTTMYSEYDGTYYYPKYSEDLVHSEVMLPENAPEEYADPSVLWNSVEMREKNNFKAQLARSYKISIPNEWSYELATEVVRDYVKRNFVDEGMCVQFAIHDSENPVTHQRNLHCHMMMTMRPILPDGTWGKKQKKIYILDADGNKIRTKKGNYKCTTQDVTGWNNKENAKRWRKSWADTINAVNEKNGLTENFWEHRSFEAQVLDIIPQIHLGEKASALERAGIQTERGNINRRIMEQNKAILTAKMLVAKGEEDKLMKLVEQRISDRRILKLIRQWLGSGVLYGNVLTISELGTSQGSVISPLLVNIYLNTLDKLWDKYGLSPGILVRYADDTVIICKNKKSANHALNLLQYIMAKLDLKLHPVKTKIVSMWDGKERSGF